jgi:hypothetical protein
VTVPNDWRFNGVEAGKSSLLDAIGPLLSREAQVWHSAADQPDAAAVDHETPPVMGYRGHRRSTPAEENRTLL